MRSAADRVRMWEQRRAREDADKLMRRILPLAAFYARSDDFEEQRTLFYDRCAKVLGWQGWEQMLTDTDSDDLVIARSQILDKPLPDVGFGGRKREIAAIERTRLIAINLSASPFEWLASHSRLETKRDAPGMGNIRFSAGIRFRDLLVGAEPAGLKSANLEGRSGGGGVPIMINDFKMDCLISLNGLQRWLEKNQPKRTGKLKTGTSTKLKAKYRKKIIFGRYAIHQTMMFDLLHRLIYKDIWVFERIPGARQKAVMEQIHNGLDQVAVYFGMITQREYSTRWKAQ